MLTSASLAIIRTQVAWRLDCDPADLLRSYVLVKPHGPRLDDYHGIYAWLMDEVAIISAPPEWVAPVQTAVAGQTIAAMRDPALWHAALGAHVERIVGPSYQGYVDAASFRPAPSQPSSQPAPHMRRIAPADLPALDRLIAACPPQDWADSAIQPDHAPIFALEQAGEFVAAASAPDDGPGVASVGVITHPAWRGRGFGAAVVAALTADRLTDGLVLHYQTLRSNSASVAIAQALGYHDLATALGIRLRR